VNADSILFRAAGPGAGVRRRAVAAGTSARRATASAPPTTARSGIFTCRPGLTG